MAGKTDPVDSEAPPSYVEATGTTSISEYRFQIAQYASQLPEAIQQSQYAQESRQERQDFEWMADLVPEVGAFLSYIATFPRQPSGAELVMVPESAVSELWTLSGSDEQRKQGDVVQLVRIRDQNPKDAKKSGENTGSTAKDTASEFDEWGRWAEPAESPNILGGGARAKESWWRDEEMARRLSAHLSLSSRENGSDSSRPAILPVPADRESLPKQKKDRGSWLPWATNKKKQASVSTPLPVPRSDNARKNTVLMMARAEEVTFRQQNELGIYESLTGWAIVLRVTCV